MRSPGAVLEDFAAALRGAHGWRRVALAFASGGFGALALPPFEFFPALLVAYAAFLLLIDSAALGAKPGRNAALVGWGFGAGYFAVGMHWIGYPFLVDPEQHAWLLPFALVLFPSGLALFYALGAAVCVRFWRPGAQRVFLFAGIFGLVEWLRGNVFTGFPWNLPGYGWSGAFPVLQSTALFGIYGLSVLTLLFGASLALLAKPDRKRAAWLPAAMTIFFLSLWGHGALRLAYADEGVVPNVRLRIVQPATPQNEKYVDTLRPRNWQRLVDLTMAPATIPPTHIIWPEAAPPFSLVGSPDMLSQIPLLTAGTLILLTGDVRIAVEDGIRKVYNSFDAFGPDGTLIETSDKFHLVPFGEYLPLEGFLKAVGLNEIAGAVYGGFTPGYGPRSFTVPGAPPLTPLICYEIIFPGQVTGEPRPAWLVNLTDDSWFGPLAGPRQHLLIAQVRAIEEGLPVIRAANSGISAIIDGNGRIRDRLELGTRGYLDGELPLAKMSTLYARFGNGAVLMILLLCFVAAYLPLRLTPR